MIQFLIQHQFWAAVAIYWIFSAAVSSMPEPAAYRPGASRPEPAVNGSAGYLWLYRFVHTIAGNLTTAFGSRIPGLKSLVLLLLIAVSLSTAACAAQYKVHPGALNPIDSAAFDTLLIAETTIDQARMGYQAGQLPSDAKDALNTLIQSYTIARESWLIYRGALANNAPPDVQELAKNLSDLTNAIRALGQVKK